MKNQPKCIVLAVIKQTTQAQKENAIMKRIYSLALLAATGSLLVASTSLQASETDDRIESSAKKSYVFKTYLKDDSIRIKSRDGYVILTGTVTDASQKSLAENTVGSLPGVVCVDNRLKNQNRSPRGTFGRVDRYGPSEIRAPCSIAM